jgi:predicted nucleic acid-binding protein
MLLDTSGLMALLDVREPLHAKAREMYAAATSRLTHGYVLAELVALGNARSVSQRPVLEFVKRLLANPDIETVWPDENLTSKALSLLLARQGHRYSLCDAVSFVLMHSHGMRESLPTDKHFEIEGFKRLLVAE